MRTMRAFLILSAIVPLVAGGTFNFFPQVPSTIAVNCTTGDCAFPSALSRANQTASPELGNADGEGLLTVAINNYYPLQPMIYFTPGSWCDTQYAMAPLALISESAPMASRRRNRRLLQDVSLTNATVSDVNVTTACALLEVNYQIGDAGAVQTASPHPGGIYAVGLGTDLPDGLTCVTITAMYATAAGNFDTEPSYTSLGIPQLTATTPFNKRICVFKFTRQSSAVVNFDMCTSNIFTVNVSSVSPLPVNITLNGEPVAEGANLLRPLVKVWGSKVTDLDGTSASVELDGSAQSEANYVAKYMPLSSAYAGEALAFPLSEALQEGFYNLSASVSLLTAYPALTSLVGLNQILQTDEPGISAGVSGLYEAATAMVHDGAIVGVQKATTPTYISAISSTSHTSGKAIATGDPITLTWKFVGAGSAVCTHDGAIVSNTVNGKCVSPLTITANAFGSTATTHSVTVVFTDVCGRQRTAAYSYTQAGLTILSAPETTTTTTDGLIVVTTVKPATTFTTGAKNAAGHSRTIATAAGTAVIGGALAALALL